MTNQNNAAHDLGTSSGGRDYIAEYFATQLRRHDFAGYINSTLAADFACTLAQHLSKLRVEGVQADEPVADAVVLQCPRCTGNGTILRLSGNGPDAYDVQEDCSHCEGSGVVASVAVAGEAQPVAWAITVPKEVSPIYWSRSEEHANEKRPDYPDGSVRRVFLDAAPQASAEPLARYCPGCGSVGPVGDEYRDCCPDGNQARMIPARLAEQCRDTFRLAIQTLLADAAANDRAAPQASATMKQPFNVAPQASEAVTVEMIQAGAKAPRECFERTGGNDPAVIYRARRAAVPATPPRRPSDDGQASWADFIAWHKRHFGKFNPVCPSHNDRLIGWQAGTNSARARRDNQTPPPSNGRTEALHG